MNHPAQSTIGQYLLNRLQELGIEHIFGVPGDYVLRFDKLIEQHPTIQFINTTRENTAGYAADAYARLRGLGVACITYGVGINITNALAQAYVENSPLVVISGTVGTDEFKRHSTLHHLINKSIAAHGDRTQLEVFKHVTVDQGVLDQPETAAAIIDRVLQACLDYKKPVYFEIPRNLVDQPIAPKAEPEPFHYQSSNPQALQEALEETQQVLSTCKRPLIWAGHELLRFGLSQELLQFAEQHKIPIVSSLLGKTVVDEHHPLFAGVYQGGMSRQTVIDLVESCDCVLIAGVIMHDLDTGIFTAKVDQEHRLVANSHSLSIGHHHYHVNLTDYIKGLNTLSLKRSHSSFHTPRHAQLPPSFSPVPEAKTTTKRVFECLQTHLKPDHIIVSDVGDCLFASSDLILSHDSFLACAYFASLGFGTPGAIGAQLADPKRRVVGIIGDGGFQMTAMELSAAVRYQLDPVIIILNNHGYGTERPLLEGSYNDILNWNYTQIPAVLGGGVGIKVETEQELDEALRQAFAKRGTFYLIEIELDKLDFSPGLRRLGELLGKVVKA
ncbi:Pyruvate decarboxylase/indolepyruvate decarboxylase [Candidatus Protochlamydia naegleriophila]|uniref:Pyruvate decarboxylase/indolepyruvate decarboxylase n=1 Tax=Candidatus Protochlamydia naegleriophila TaxID=389348 RepID=A0A0U5JB82_9BACT|nr:thiamine pyrophosphate-dependent enzyme [Candidatus Protochlamydia naegleriophila]CUI15938.1 Pyruvate decarboxylase/indolepyruvate decarboxylase [Candidatus Protochlamydia naegleriophila]